MHILLEALKIWLEINMYDRYVLILPNFKIDENEWLLKYQNVCIYNCYHEKISKSIIEEQDHNMLLLKKGDIERVPTVFFGIDDITINPKELFDCRAMSFISSFSRSYRVQSWIIVQSLKHCLSPRIEASITRIPLISKDDEEKERYEKIVNFLHHWNKNSRFRQYHGCLLIKSD